MESPTPGARGRGGDCRPNRKDSPIKFCEGGCTGEQDFETGSKRGSLTILGKGKYNYGLPLGFGGEMYAVIQTGGKQYRVAPGDTIRIERVKGDVGEQVKFGTVLAVHTDDKKVMAGSGAANHRRTGQNVGEGGGQKNTVF